jgi:hypothetical protein
MFFYSYILEFLVDVLSMDLYTDAVFEELISPFVKLNITAFWF